MTERYQGSLRLRLVIPILSALLVVIGFLSVMSEALMADSLRGSEEQAASKIADLIARDPDVNADLISTVTSGIQERLNSILDSEPLVLAVAVYSAGTETGIYRLVHSEVQREHLAALVPQTITSVGDILVPSRSEEHVVDGHSIISVARAIDAGSFGTPLLDSLPADVSADSSTAPVAEYPALGMVRLSYSLKAAEDEEAQYRYLILLVAGLLMLFSGLAADRMARHMLAPVYQLHQALQAATEGNLKVRLEETTTDELGAIANRFNIMVQRLDENREEIQNHNRTLEKRVAARTDELSKAYRELQTVDKAKHAFLSNVSHEMRTPLTSIVASAEILSEFTEQDESSRQEFLEIIHLESGRLLRQIGSILEMAKMEAETPVLMPASANLEEIVQRVIELFSAPLQKKHLTLSCHPGDADLALVCDAKYIGKVVTSVIENAITYSPRGGTIDIRLVVHRSKITLEVIDDGPGVPENRQDILFTVFGQLSDGLTDKPKGLGIGLAISKRIAEAHGGDLRYIQVPGRGACFRLTLLLSVPAELSGTA